MKKSFYAFLISPLNGRRLESIDDTSCQFAESDKYPLIDSIPVLVTQENSLFRIDEIKDQRPLTQNKNYSNKSSIKNFIRTTLLPKLNTDWDLKKRYSQLAEQVKGGKVLIIGAGNKVEFYREIFKASEFVVTSDIHLQFRPDVVFDVHEIPFQDNTFDLVLAGQVLEHTIRPWVAAQEMERVVVQNGLIQIETPFAFPYHGAPYDFFRFTFTGMRALFRNCKVSDFKASEGKFTAVAVTNAQALLELSRFKSIRYFMLVLGRFLFFWLKYLDLFSNGRKLTDLIWPKGLVFTFIKDGKKRNDADCLLEFGGIK